LLEIHASDYDGIDEKHQLPGTGVVDWKSVMQALRSVEFQGPINYEVAFKPDVPLAERIRTLEENFHWLLSL
jgi:sugar phosphate isomerase/epimerase